MNLQDITTVLEIVFHPRSWSRQFTRLSHRHESRIKPISQRWTKDEPAGFHAKNKVDVLADVALGEQVDQGGVTELVFQECRDVVKQYPFLGKIRNLPDELFQMVGVQARLEHYHAPSIRKTFRPWLGGTSLSSTKSTRAARGPCCRRCRNPDS